MHIIADFVLLNSLIIVSCQIPTLFPQRNSIPNSFVENMQMVEIMSTSKSIVITGHSIGGAIASLLTLWLLCRLQTICSVICITFGSPMLGNESFSRAILQQRWAGYFCHVVSQHDIVPRLFFAPSCSFQFISEENKTQLFRVVLDSLGVVSKSDCKKSSFCPSGSYLFCTNKGAVCVDNGMLVIKLLYLLLLNGSQSSSLEDHFGYADFIQKVQWQFIENRSFMGGNLPESSYEAGITLALESLGIASHVMSSSFLVKYLHIPSNVAEQFSSRKSNVCSIGAISHVLILVPCSKGMKIALLLLILVFVWFVSLR